jgi:hypothetical protein
MAQSVYIALHYLSSSLSVLAIPQSIERLTMLQTLCLRGYELGDISIPTSLTRLEILDLRSSTFNELPQGITTYISETKTSMSHQELICLHFEVYIQI